MDPIKQKILQRIQDLKAIPFQSASILQAAEEIYAGTLSIAGMLYGFNAPQFSYLRELRSTIAESKYNENSKYSALYQSVIGYLNNFEKEINADLIVNLERKISGDLFSDFIAMAKGSMDANSKDVAVVLACAALEDALKQFATLNGLDVYGKDMSEVVNSLKANSLIAGPQLKLLQSYTTLRNKAFHAEWAKIDTPDVKSLIAFVEDFLLKHFT